MLFKVTPNDVFFTVPTEEELHKAEDAVAKLCREHIKTCYDNNTEIGQYVHSILETELEKMHTTDMGFHFLILYDIAQCSREAGYPIISLGNFSGSWIAYLLGITDIEPLPYYTPEIVWGSDANLTKPDCTIGIAPPVRSILQKYLDEQRGFSDCDMELFRRISLADNHTCEQLGALAQATGENPSVDDLDDATYLRAAKDIIAEIFEENSAAIPLVEEMAQSGRLSFDSLLRLYAFAKGEFSNENGVLDLNYPNFFVTREEFFSGLIRHNIPVEIAAEIVKKGVWATGAKRDKYVAILESYQAPEAIIDYFFTVKNLWSKGSCVGRVLQKCYLAWYREHCPE